MKFPIPRNYWFKWAGINNEQPHCISLCLVNKTNVSTIYAALILAISYLSNKTLTFKL